MATPYIMPLGFIYRPTEDGAIITLTDPRDSLGLKLATPVTIWRYSQGQLATAKIRGQVTAVGYMTATFKTVESRIDPRWPTSRQLLRPKTPVYLAMPDSFEPDMSRKLTQEQVESMQRAAARYTEITRPTIPNPPNLNPPNEPNEGKNAKTKHHKPRRFRYSWNELQ